MRERIILDGDRAVTVRSGNKLATIPLARIVRDDGKPRTHHPRCPYKPGAPLDDHTVCADCIYGEHPELVLP